MVVCGCGKAIEKVPSWLTSVNIQFVCNNCPNRTIKGITEVTLEQQTLRQNSLGALDEGFAPKDEDEEEDEK